jgi:hypothetical protein
MTVHMFTNPVSFQLFRHRSYLRARELLPPRATVICWHAPIDKAETYTRHVGADVHQSEARSLSQKTARLRSNNMSSRRRKGNTMKKPAKKPKAEGKIIFSVRLDVAERDALERAAKADDRTAAAVVRRLIRDFLKDGGLLK